MTEQVVESRLAISREYLHHHAISLLNEYEALRSLVERPISAPIALTLNERRQGKRRYLGVQAQSINSALKSAFGEVDGWQFEATVRDGVILGSAEHDVRIEGFDIARFDQRANLARLWSVCFGRRTVQDGAELWRRYLYSRPQLLGAGEELDGLGTPGVDLVLDAIEPTVLGEIQFGNWALAYRDIMKLLAAAVETQVDLFVYVAADGRLSSMISQGTVNFERMRDILTAFSAVVSIPTWLVGIDFADGQEPAGM